MAMACASLVSYPEKYIAWSTSNWIVPMVMMLRHWEKRNTARDWKKNVILFTNTFNYPLVIKNPKLKSEAEKRHRLYWKRFRREIYKGCWPYNTKWDFSLRRETRESIKRKLKRLNNK